MAGVDRQKLLERVDGKVSLLKRILQAFEEALPERTAAIEAAISSHDGNALRRAAHALKGSAANFEYPPATEAALELELMGLHRRWEGAEQKYLELRREISHLLDGVREVIAG